MFDKIRLATVEDCKEILQIYQFYVENTPISFEIKIPTLEEFSTRIERISKEYPYLVYESNNHILGYCYGTKHREREAYCYNVDVSIYVLSNYHSKGIASKLYQGLFSLLKELGYYNVFAAYTLPNEKSMKLHQRFGFTPIGTYENVGYKLEKWHHVTWVQKKIKEDYETPKELKMIGELPVEIIDKVLKEIMNKVRIDLT